MPIPGCIHALLFTKMREKAQIQIGETVAVLFVFFILVIIGFIFYVNVIKSNLESEKEELSQLNSVAIAQKTIFLPELQCSESNSQKESCIDILKLESAQAIMRENEIYYYDLLEFSNVTVLQIYPEERRWEPYSRKTGNFTNKFVTNVPISLYDPVARRHSFGVITIETFSR